MLIGATALLLGLGLGASEVRVDPGGALEIAAETAARNGDWPAAFRSYRELHVRYPGDVALLAALEAAAGHLVDELADAGPAAQQELVTSLAAAALDDLLASAVDRCTAAIPAGWFVMGSETGRADERPVRRVLLGAFRIDRYEVTNAQYERFVRATDRRPPRYWTAGSYPAGEAAYPVLGVSWDDADAYCSWAGKRLPTEAEWERACRGSTGRTYPWGDSWDASRANISSGLPLVETQPRPTDPAWDIIASPQPIGLAGPRPVGSFPAGATAEGVHDLVGNAAEWVADWYSWDGYGDLPIRDPIGTGPPWNRVLRGSAWLDPYGRPDWVERDARCAARDSSHVLLDPRFGFRCAADGTPRTGDS